ncbi:MAG: hypothetical protein IMY73_04475 [Bacteroidetes bacterium]|nr:hypothetical protein [Bacteroidota bacterium]
MVTKIQELTDKLYEEGLQKGKAESQRLIEEAEAQSKKIVADAKKKATEIVEEAENKSSVLSNNTLKEMNLATKQALADVKQTINELLTKSIVSPQTKSSFKDDNFIKELILNIVQEWSKTGDINAQVQIPEDKVKNINDFITSSVKEHLDKGISIKGSNIKEGFRIAKTGESYYINFTDKEFDAFFSAYVRPRLSSILYGEE